MKMNAIWKSKKF